MSWHCIKPVDLNTFLTLQFAKIAKWTEVALIAINYHETYLKHAMQKYLPSVPEQNTIQSQWCTWCWSNNLIGGLVELVHSTILGIKTIPDLIGSLFIRKTIYLYTKVSTKEGIIKSINNTFMEKDYANVRYVFWCAELCGKCYTIRIFSFIFAFGCLI